MIHLLVAYRRSTQELLAHKAFTEGELDRAMEERLRLDLEHWHEDDVEIVVLTSDTEEALRSTHGRYFLTGPDLAARIGTTVRSGQRQHRVRWGRSSAASAACV